MKLQDVPRRVHFVGVGGIGTSALAQHLRKLGYSVTGSDRIENDRVKALRSEGVPVFIGHNAELAKNAELVVRTSAVNESDVEIAAARGNNVKTVLREELLGAIFDGYGVRVAVCGTHGKTTVTAMIHHILQTAGYSHAAFIGGVYRGNNYYFGENAVVAEACEYNRSFMYLHPTVTVCLNAEFDHPDCYEDIADVRRSFGLFFKNTAENGTVILPKNLEYLSDGRKTVFYDCAVTRNVKTKRGKSSFELFDEKEKTYVKFKLNVAGCHNVSNALAAVCAVGEMGVSVKDSAAALSTFCGVERRWTEKQSVCKVICDYAHHPTEIACSLQTARDVSHGRVLCVFQPHTYTRTKAFEREFCSCFSLADEVCYLPVYSAREQPIAGVDHKSLAKRCREENVNARYADTFEEAVNWIKSTAKKDDVVLILGAGDVVEIADML